MGRKRIGRKIGQKCMNHAFLGTHAWRFRPILPFVRTISFIWFIRTLPWSFLFLTLLEQHLSVKNMTSEINNPTASIQNPPKKWSMSRGFSLLPLIPWYPSKFSYFGLSKILMSKHILAMIEFWNWCDYLI